MTGVAPLLDIPVGYLSTGQKQRAVIARLLSRERPIWLLDEPLSGDLQVAENDLPPDSLRTRRADLAQFLIDCAMGDDWIHNTPFIARPEADSFERPTALLDEFLPH